MKCKLCPPYFATLAQPSSFFAIWSPHSSVSRRPAHVIPLILFQCRPQHWSGVRDMSACHIWSDNPFLAKGLSHLQHHPNIKGNPAQERVTRECSASGRTPRISWRRFFSLSQETFSTKSSWIWPETARSCLACRQLLSASRAARRWFPTLSAVLWCPKLSPPILQYQVRARVRQCFVYKSAEISSTRTIFVF